MISDTDVWQLWEQTDVLGLQLAHLKKTTASRQLVECQSNLLQAVSVLQELFSLS